MFEFTSRINKIVENLESPILNLLYKRLGLTPNKISVLSFLLGIASFIFLISEKIETSLVFLALALLFDSLDGSIARKFNLESQLGQKLELIFDRINEFMLFMGLVYIKLVDFKVALLAIIATLLVSLVRDKSKFDPGFKRISLFFGYFFGFNLAIKAVFIINLAGFTISLLILDYKFQKKLDLKAMP